MVSLFQILDGEKGCCLNCGPYYEADVLRYFGEHIQERTLYEALFAALDTCLPESTVKVQKSQISFYNRHLFAAVSLPVWRKKDWPEHCLLVTFGLAARLDHPHIAVAVEPYPNRWTHHVVLAQPEEIDEELLGWIEAAYQFANQK